MTASATPDLSALVDLYLAFSDDGQHIRRWSRGPFEGAAHFALSIPAGTGEGELRIGDKVEVIGQYEADFRGQDWWVAGIRVHDSGEGLDVTLAEQWPIPNRNWREYRGQTDGFRPEELRIVATASPVPVAATHVAEHLDVANAAPDEMVLVPREPTEAMIEAARAAFERKVADMMSQSPTEHPDDGGGPYGYAFRAMLAASTPKDTGERIAASLSSPRNEGEGPP